MTVDKGKPRVTAGRKAMDPPPDELRRRDRQAAKRLKEKCRIV